MTSKPRDKTRDSRKPDTAKFGLDLHEQDSMKHGEKWFPEKL